MDDDFTKRDLFTINDAMGYIKNVVKQFTGFAAAVAGLSVVKQKDGDWFFMVGNSRGTTWKFENPTQYVEAFEACPPLATVLLRKSQYTTNGKIKVLNLEDKDESNTDFAKKLRKLLKRPNCFQSGKQFRAQYTLYKNMVGYCPILVVNPVGFSGLRDSTQLFILPPWFTKIEMSGLFLSATKQSDLFKSIVFNYNNKPTPINIENVIILRDSNLSCKNAVLPDSRMKPLGEAIGTVVNGLKSNNTIIRKRGGIGILSNGGKDAIGSMPLKPEDKAEVQNKLQQNYGLSDEQSEIIVTNANLNWQPMAFDAAQLKIHESVDMATNMIVDQYGFNVMLLSSSKNPTLNNAQALEKAVYQNTIIPEAETDIETIADFFKCEENKCRIEIDFDDVDALQTSKKDDAQARATLSQSLEREFKNNVITLNQWMEELDIPTIDGGDQYYYQLVALGWVFDKTTFTIQQQPTN